MSDDSIRDNLIEVFVAEAVECLHALDTALRSCDGAIPAADAVQEQYRVGHKLKGAAALYQFHGISAIGDLFERILEHARATPEVIWPQVVGLLRELLDDLRSRLEAASQTGSEPSFDAERWQGRYQAILSGPGRDRSKGEASATPGAQAGESSESGEDAATESGELHIWASDVIVPAIDAEVLEYFVPEIEELLATAEEHATALAKNPDDPDRVHHLFRAVHTMKGSSYTVGYQVIGDVALPLEDCLRGLRDRRVALPPRVLELTTQMLGLIRTIIQRKPDSVERLKQDIPNLLRQLRVPSAGAQTQPPVHDTAALQPSPQTAPTAMAVGTRGPEAATESSGQTMSELSDAYLLPELDAEVLSYFVPEAQEHLEALEAYLLKLEKDPHNPELIHQLFRIAHTLKGSAFTVGFTPIGDLVHYVEDLMGALREGKTKLAPGTTDAILKSVDVVRLLMRRDASILPQIRSRFSAVVGELQRLSDGSAAVIPAKATPIATPPTRSVPEAAPKEGAQGEEAATGQSSDVIRVNRERLEKLLNLVGELVIGRGRLEQRLLALETLANQVQAFKGKMVETVRGFEEKHAFTLPSQSASPAAGPAIPGLQDFGSLEFDKYDDFNILARRISEVTADVTESMSQLSSSIRNAREDMSQLHHLTLSMRDEIARARMVAIGTPFTRFRRAVREMARATGKEVTLITSGEQTEVDTNIVERLVDPLIHLVRNAVYHGIEPTGTRIAACKPAVGTVYLHAAHRGNAITIEVEDDGAGIDPEKLKAKAVSKGLITQQIAKSMSEAEAMKLIFLPGFSTAESIGDQAGRGVGLDAVKKTIESMNGFIEIETAKGIGTKFTLNLPLTLLIATALLVRVGSVRYAIPLQSVLEVTLPGANALQRVASQIVLQVGEEAVPVQALTQVLTGMPADLPGASPIVLVRGAKGPVGLAVDELLGRQEIVVKPLGALKILERSCFSGATIDPEGRVVLVVDVARIGASESASVAFEEGSAGALEAGTAAPALESQTATGPAVLLVDDSLSIRKFVARMLESAGYTVDTAVDGEEGVRKASATSYRMIITDLEMPKLNGYEVIQALRARPQTQSVPIVVMTTRAGDKHKQLALNIGASGYIAKPVEERALIAEVERWVGAPTAARKD